MGLTSIHRLAAANPAAYEPDLAASLNNYAVRLAELGRPQAAAGDRREARKAIRGLSKSS